MVKREVFEKFFKLPYEFQKLIMEDLDTAFENRVKVMERINDTKRKS